MKNKNFFRFFLMAGLVLPLLVCTSGDDSLTGTVSNVTVTPSSAIVGKGRTQAFTATVTGTNNPDQKVTWTVSGGVTGTTISSGGELAVAANETAQTLTVQAVSAADSTKSGTAAVAVRSLLEEAGWSGLTAPSTTKVTSSGSYQGKSNVNHIAPNSSYGWAVLTYPLDAYAGKEITISVSMDVWLETSSKIAWQVNNASYPVIAGSTDITLSAGQWHTVTGNNTITVEAADTVLYLSGAQLGNAKAYIAGLVIAIYDESDAAYDPKDMMTLPPLKDQFADYFMIGNIATGSSDYSSSAITNQRLTRHYNVLTAENNMKPSYYSSSVSTSTGAVTISSWSNADNFVNAATNSGFKIVGHTLLWHSQIPSWQQNINTNITNKDIVLTAMNDWITQVVTRYEGKIYSWDILNEIFPDGVSASANWRDVMRSENPWYAAIGADFVYEGFKAARLADSSTILYYNDYNLDTTGKATMVRDMVRDVNNQWASDSDNTDKNRLLIEGIGMQSHHNINVTANAIKASLDLFKPLGVKISISELDILSQSYSAFAGGTAPTDTGKEQAANLYGEYFKLFIDYKDIIERVTFWGVYDEQSWRAAGLPLIFEGASTSRAKPAYYKVIEALGK